MQNIEEIEAASDDELQVIQSVQEDIDAQEDSTEVEIVEEIDSIDELVETLEAETQPASSEEQVDSTDVQAESQQ